MLSLATEAAFAVIGAARQNFSEAKGNPLELIRV